MLPGIEMDVVALDDPTQSACARRDRRNPHQGSERHQGLLEPAGGNRRGLRRRPLPHRRYRLHGRGRLFLSGRPQEGHDHLRRLQRLSADDRAGDLRASCRARSDRDRHSRRLSRRGGQGLRQAARRRAAVQPRGPARVPAGKLGKHELPAALDFVDELPRTPVGKLSRHELRSCSPRNNRNPDNNNSQQEVVHDRRRHRLHRPHPDRQGLSRRPQRHRGRDAARPRHRRRRWRAQSSIRRRSRTW